MGNFSFTHKSEERSNEILHIEKFFIDNEFDSSLLNSKTVNDNLINIAEGSFSHVYSFRDKYAIKVMKNNYCGYLDNISEIMILCSLKSEYLIKCYGLFTINSKLSIIMEKIECNLSNYKFKNNHDRELVIFQLCKGLEFLHDKGILHLDFVPNNILVREKSGIPKIFISDFSHSCMTFNLTVSSISHRISPFYRPYENLKGSLIYSDKSDIWSLGIIIYEILNDIKLENIIIPVVVDLEYDSEMSIILFIERMVAWNKWPLKINNSSIDINKFLSLQANDRILFKNYNNLIITNNVIPSFNIYGIINDDITPYYQRTEQLYMKIISYYNIKYLENFFINEFDLYKICFCVVYSLYNFPDKVTLLLRCNHSIFILKMLSDFNFEI